MICGIGFDLRVGTENIHRVLAWPSEFWDVLPSGSDSKESSCNVGDLGVIPGS